MKTGGAGSISVCEEDDKRTKGPWDDVVEMPRGIPEMLSPIPYVMSLQLLAYHLEALLVFYGNYTWLWLLFPIGSLFLEEFEDVCQGLHLFVGGRKYSYSLLWILVNHLSY